MTCEPSSRKERKALVAATVTAFCAGVVVASMVSTTGRVWGATPEAEYLSENDAAMATMMKAMAAEPSGDIDRDFVTMMVPHHQGAIDMAVSFLKYGRNDQLRRIAQEIIVDQQQEIVAMKLAIGEPLPPQGAVPTQPVPNLSELPARQMAPNMKM